jgi:uncharacterized damage-inducible protein DinB
MTFPEATDSFPDRAHVLAAYLDYFREYLIGKVTGLPSDEVRRSRLASGWTPISLLKHVTYVERRWIVWGFEGKDIGEPWADSRDGVWYAAPEENLDDIVAALRMQGEKTREVALSTDLDQLGVPGDRWDGADPASLERVLLHLMQEYAQHAGHIDIVAETATSSS